jgi:hypothetical protein
MYMPVAQSASVAKNFAENNTFMTTDRGNFR